ncbi:MAG: thiamine diphosphokinase [Melioribacteraceae bacterium]|nr:thiamine diphosphokinase [Melioribacteraceae bacterium]
MPGKAIIIGNGKIPPRGYLEYLQTKGFNDIICADGGAEHARKLNLIPSVIIGDLDSVKSETLEYYKPSVRIIYYQRQNDTDIEKSIKYAVSRKYSEIVLCAVTGNRLDHSFCNIGVMLKFSDRIKISILHDDSIMYVISGVNKIKTHKGETISVYGIDGKTKFTSKGLKYKLGKVSLPFGVKESTSNKAESGQVEIIVTGGKGIIVRESKIVKKYGLLFYC